MKNPNYLCSCPFCGSDKPTVFKFPGSTFYSVACGDGKCPMNNALLNWFDTEEEARRFWNTRYGMEFNQEKFLNNDVYDTVTKEFDI